MAVSLEKGPVEHACPFVLALFAVQKPRRLFSTALQEFQIHGQNQLLKFASISILLPNDTDVMAASVYDVRDKSTRLIYLCNHY